MKRHLFFFCGILLFSGSIFGQVEKSDEYIEISDHPVQREFQTFSNTYTHHGFSIGVSSHYGQIDGEDALLFGVNINYIMNHYFEVGVGGNWFYSEQPALNFAGDDIVYAGGYGGLRVAPAILALEKVHVSFPLLIGGGAVGYFDEELDDIFEYNHHAEDWDVLFAIEPGANIVFNITRFFQVELGLTYRFTSEVKLDDLEKKNLNGFSAGIGLKFGRL